MKRLVLFVSAHRNLYRELGDEMPKVLRFLQAFRASAVAWRERVTCGDK